MPESFSIHHLNVRSLPPKLDDIKAFVVNENVDVLCLSETWLSPMFPSNIISIPEFVLLRQDRRDGYGGVAIYLKNNIQYSIIHTDHTIEQLWIRVGGISSHRSLAIGVVYNPHRNSYNTFLESLHNSISIVFPTCDELICTGDFNIDLLDGDSTPAGKFFELCDTFGLTQVVNVPTRVTDTSSSLLDYIVVSDKQLIKSVGVEPFLSDLKLDHYLVSCTLTFVSDAPRIIYRNIRDFRYFDRDKLLRDLIVAPFHKMFRIHDIDEKVGFFNNLLTELFAVHAPLRRVRITKLYAPWMTNNLRLLMRSRDKAQQRWKRTKNDADFNYYKSLRNQVTLLCRQEKKSYFENCISTNDMKSIWRNLRPPKNCCIPEALRDVEALNEFFVGRNELDPDQRCIDEYMNNSMFGGAVAFSFESVLPDKVAELMSTIKTESVGVDGIGVRLLSLCFDFIVPFLTHILNCCLEQGIFPDIWKIAIVRPVPKTAVPAEFRDLRPISILPVLSKILEKIMCEQLRNYLASHGVIPEQQSGFRPLHSCGTALLHIKDDILRAKDAGLVTALVLFDFSKAFDMINHDLLLAICSHVGMSDGACRLLRSYLSGRQQSVHIDELQSNVKCIPAGVPQGSVLGPLLYILYTHGMPEIFKHCKAHFYADDTQIYYSFPPSDLLLAKKRVDDDVGALLNYADSHCLKINHTKTKVILFGPNNILQNITNIFSVNVGGLEVKPVPEARNLGVIFDSSLHFRSHVSECVRRGYGKLKLIYNKRYFMSKEVKSNLCNALVLSSLNFCDYVYGPSIDAKDAHRIQVLQNSCLRLIYGVRRRQRISHRLRENNWLSMANRRLHHAAVLFHKIILFKSPPYLLNKITYRSDVHNLNIRFGGTVSIPLHKTEAYKSSFTYQVSSIYNNVPQYLKAMNSKAFKIHYWKLLFHNQ